MSVRYDDMQGPMTQGAGTAALTLEAYRDTTYLMYMFRHDQNDTIHIPFQFFHRKQLGSPLASIHVHCIPLVNPATPQVVDWRVRYTWQTTGGTFPALATWGSSNTTMNVGTADAFKSIYHTLVSNIAAPANEGYSSILLATIQRYTGAGTSDTYNTNKGSGTTQANLGLLYVDIHYATDRDGSVNEGSD